MRHSSGPTCFFRPLALVFFLVMMAGFFPARGAEGRARLTGKVVDEQGNFLAGVKVKFVRAGGEQGRTVEATTDKKGKFLLGFFPSGTYQAEIAGGELTVLLVKSSIGGAASSGEDDGSNVTRQGGSGRNMDQDAESRPGFGERGAVGGPRGAAEGTIFEVPAGVAADIVIVAAEGGYKPETKAPAAAEIVEVKPGEAPPECSRAVEALKSGKLPEAVAEAEKVLAAKPEPRTEGFALAVKGTALWLSGDSAQAVAALGRGKELAPDYPGIQGLLGTALIQAGDKKKEAGQAEEAARDFNAAADLLEAELRRSPGSVGLMNNRLAALERAGRGTEAAGLLRDLLAANPRDDRARIRLADFLTEAGQPKEALAELGKVAAGSEELATSIYNAGVVLFNRGDMDGLLAALEKPLQEMPGQAVLHNLAGRAHLVEGNNEKAILELKEFLRLAPDSPDAPDIREILEQLEKPKPRR